MTQTGIFIGLNEFKSWPQALQDQLIERLFGSSRIALNIPTPVVEMAAPLSDEIVEDEHFAELSPSQAREFLNGCGKKTKAAVIAMASSNDRFFQLRDVALALKMPASELSGVWSGLTRRIRTVTCDPAAYLIYWHGEAQYDEDGNYIDHRGELNEMTYVAFRKALRIS